MANKSGQVINCKAAVCWEPLKPMTIETIQVLPPVKDEVRIKLLVANICHTDAHQYLGQMSEMGDLGWPIVLGHEAIGVVESIGSEVSSLKPGDHVMTLFQPHCGSCALCLNPKTNICLRRAIIDTAFNGETRYKIDGRPLYHLTGIGSFSEYAVVYEAQLVKIDPIKKLENICSLSCGFSTGFGSAAKVGGVDKGSSVGIWGLGTIGLAAATGALFAGAKMIIGIDVNDDKQEIGKKFGCTHFINPKNLAQDTSVENEIKKLTNGIGLDCAIECVGHNSVLEIAYNSLAPYGQLVMAGVPSAKQLPLNPYELLLGKKVTGAMFGGYKSKEGVTILLAMYNEGKISKYLDMLVTQRIKLEEINDGFKLLLSGKALRTYIDFRK